MEACGTSDTSAKTLWPRRLRDAGGSVIHCHLQAVARWMPRGGQKRRRASENGRGLSVETMAGEQRVCNMRPRNAWVRRASQILTGWPCTRPVFARGSMRYSQVTRASRGLIGLFSRERQPPIAGAENSKASNSVPRTGDIIFSSTPHYPCKESREPPVNGRQ